MQELWSDVRYACRAIYKAPGFSLTVMATLAIGLGATVAIFSVVNALLLRPLPYPDSDRMVMVWQDMTRRDGPEREWFTPPDFIDLREQATSFAALAAVGNWSPALTTADGAESIGGAVVSSAWFDVVGVRPALGAAFRRETETPDSPPVVVLSHGLWQRHFGGDPGIIGSTVVLNDVSHEVVGVMPAGFRDPLFDAELWRSRVINPATCGRGCFTMRVVGRLNADASLALAHADANVVAARLAAEYPTNRDVSFNVVGLKADLTAEARPALIALAAAVTLLLLITIVNVANLLVARAGVRERELAIRTAIGARRSAIIRQMLVETTVLGVFGAAAAALLAVWAVDVLTALAPVGTPRIEDVAVDGMSLGFALTAGLVAAVLAALGPAFQATRGRLADVLKESGGHRASVGRRRVRSGLVVAEIAIALTLLIGSGLTLRSLAQLQQVDPGFRSAGLIVGDYFLPAARYAGGEQVRAFVAEALERVGSIPGVTAVATTSSLPMDAGGDSDFDFHIEGRVLGPDEQPPATWYRTVSPDWFELMGTPIVAGRSFSPEDRTGSDVWSIIINEEFRRRHFPGEDPVGRRVRIGGQQMAEIVGIAANTRHRGLGSAPVVELFMNTLQYVERDVTIVVHTASSHAAVGAAIRDAVRAIDPALPPPTFRTMDDLVAQSIALPRLYSAFFTFFALVALLLSAVGVYGLTAYTVGQRRQEFGIRMALGARAGDVVSMVVRHALLLTAVGLGIGLLGAFALARPLAVLLFEVAPYDVATFAAVTALLGVIALVASWLPARRATRVDPLAALRPE